MTVDNTTLNPAIGGDIIRTIGKTTSSGASKTQVILLDIGGGDGSGESIVGPNNPVPFERMSVPWGASQSVEAFHVISTVPASLSRIDAVIGGTSGYLMLFDSTSVPSNGSVTPAWARAILSDGSEGGDTMSFDPPIQFSTGLIAVFSSTGPFTKTASVTAAFFWQVTTP